VGVSGIFLLTDPRLNRMGCLSRLDRNGKEHSPPMGVRECVHWLLWEAASVSWNEVGLDQSCFPLLLRAGRSGAPAS
jgi:hypothetical protein